MAISEALDLLRLAAQDLDAAQILYDKGLWPVSCFTPNKPPRRR